MSNFIINSVFYREENTGNLKNSLTCNLVANPVTSGDVIPQRITYFDGSIKTKRDFEYIPYRHFLFAPESVTNGMLKIDKYMARQPYDRDNDQWKCYEGMSLLSEYFVSQYLSFHYIGVLNDDDIANVGIVSTLSTLEDEPLYNLNIDGISDYTGTDIVFNGTCIMDNPYREENNLNNEPLKLIINAGPRPNNSQYSTTTTFTVLNNNDELVQIRQVPYIIADMGTLGSGKDIEFDHLDKIDYITNFKIRFNLDNNF